MLENFRRSSKELCTYGLPSYQLRTPGAKRHIYECMVLKMQWRLLRHDAMQLDHVHNNAVQLLACGRAEYGKVNVREGAGL